jgi:hypothetical protein
LCWVAHALPQQAVPAHSQPLDDTPSQLLYPVLHEVKVHWPLWHEDPAFANEHATHAPPVAPQAVSLVPVWHWLVPPMSQHPPWQGWLALHDVTQRCDVASHAVAVGQSLAVAQATPASPASLPASAETQPAISYNHALLPPGALHK